MASAAEKITVVCACGAQAETRPNKDGEPKVPRRWRRLSGAMVCHQCVADRYYTRAFRVPMRGLAGDTKDERTKKDFYAALTNAGRESAQFANWYVRKLELADDGYDPSQQATTKDGKTKLPALPAVDYYGDAVSRFKHISGAGLSALAQIVERYYRADRFAVLVALNRRPRSYRFGELPIEIRRQSWSLVREEGADGGSYWAIRAQITPGKSYTIKLWADRDAMVRLRQIESGAAEPLACKIVRASKPGPGGKPRKVWFFRIAALFPRVDRSKRATHTLALCHDANLLLVGRRNASDAAEDRLEIPGRKLRVMISGGDVADRQWQQQDSTARGLWSRRKRQRVFARDRASMASRRNLRIIDQIKLVADAVGRWCVSHDVGEVVYTATDRGWITHFPWYRLQAAIGNRLERDAIAYTVLGAAGKDTEIEVGKELAETP